MAKTVQDYSFNIEDRPGALADVAELLAKEGINVEGGLGITSQGKGVIHLHTNNAQATAKALQQAGIKFDKRELLEISVQDKPGELAKISRALADAGVNLRLFYITMKKTVVVDVDNASAAKQVFQKLGL